MGDIDTHHQQLEFLGHITAGVTHEMNNVLSIINEYPGLIEDQIYMAENGSPVSLEKLYSIQNKLAGQVDRGKHMMKNLNKFAHVTDQQYTGAELNDILENLVYLMLRFARNKDINLKLEISDRIMVYNNIGRLMHMLYIAIQYILEYADGPGDIIVTTAKQGNTASVALDSFPPSKLPGADIPEDLQTIAADIGAIVDLLYNENETSLTLHIHSNIIM